MLVVKAAADEAQPLPEQLEQHQSLIIHIQPSRKSHLHILPIHEHLRSTSCYPVSSGVVFAAMKSALILATGLLGLADAGVHKMK